MDDLISVVLPVYNGERYLRESIESIIAQSYQNWELLILDDCSTDNSADIAIEFTKKDSRIHYYKNETNLRLPRNLNKGFSLAKGSFLTWTSDDNRFKPEALKKMRQALVSNRAQFVFASCRIIDSQGKEIEYIMVNDLSKKKLVGMNSVGACFMYTRKAYEQTGEYNPDLLYVEDFDYWQRLYARFGAVTVNEILYEYRWHDGALTSTMRKDVFNKNLETTLLNNRSAFGKLDDEEEYYYYCGLYNCRKNLKDLHNPYKFKYLWHSTKYSIKYRFPRRLKRLYLKIREVK